MGIPACSYGHFFDKFVQGNDVTHPISRLRKQLLVKVVLFMQYRIENLVTFEKPLYTVPETAEMLSLSRTTLYELIKAGKIIAVYPTSKARIPATSIVSFVKKQEEDARLDTLSKGYVR
jgi:excisionase family DNA binding protein